MLALLVAMSIVFSRVLSISTGFVRFNLGSLPVLLAALLFGFFRALGNVYTGFAFGIGLDRLAMIRWGIRDIRALIENDVRFLAQFQ